MVFIKKIKFNLTFIDKFIILYTSILKGVFMNLQDLKKPIPFKFKPQSVKFGKAVMVAYIDARDVQDLLDEVVGPGNWQSDYKVINENLYAGIGIRINTIVNYNDAEGKPQTYPSEEWVWKWDCGTESNQEAEKGEASDAFKRAAVQWGIGRFLYRLGVVELPTKEYNGKERPATHDGRILWTNDDITKYIGEIKGGKKPEPKKEKKYETPAKEPKYAAKNTYNEKTIQRVSSLEKNGRKGKECLSANLKDFNQAKNLSYKTLAELDDGKLNELIDFIEAIPPKV